MQRFYVSDKKPKKIDLAKLKKLNDSMDLCSVVYTTNLEEALDVPGEIKAAWCAYSDAKDKFEKTLAKHDIKL